MAWIKVDERFFECPESLEIGPVASMIYLQAVAYALKHNMNGVVPAGVIKRAIGRGKPGAVAKLVNVGLLIETDNSYVIVDKWVESDVMVRRQPIPVWMRERILSGASCAYCGTPDDLCIDHILPVSRGGESKPNNLQALCRSCNSFKGAS